MIPQDSHTFSILFPVGFIRHHMDDDLDDASTEVTRTTCFWERGLRWGVQRSNRGFWGRGDGGRDDVRRSDGGFWPIFDTFTHYLGEMIQFWRLHIYYKKRLVQPPTRWEVMRSQWCTLMLMGLKNLDQNNNVNMVQDYERISCPKSFLSNFMLIM